MPIPPIQISPRQWSELQAAAAVLGIRAAARQFAQALPPEHQKAAFQRIRKHAERHRWLAATVQAAKIPAQPRTGDRPPLVLAPSRQLPAKVAAGLSAGPEKPAQEAASVAGEPPALVTGASMIAAILAKRRERSGLFLSHYLVSATRTLAGSKGDLDLADRASQLARTRQALWPEQGSAAGSELAIRMDDAGRVREIHSRLVLSLTGRQDDRLAGSQAPDTDERG